MTQGELVEALRARFAEIGHQQNITLVLDRVNVTNEMILNMHHEAFARECLRQMEWAYQSGWSDCAEDDPDNTLPLTLAPDDWKPQ